MRNFKAPSRPGQYLVEVYRICTRIWNRFMFPQVEPVFRGNRKTGDFAKGRTVPTGGTGTVPTGGTCFYFLGPMMEA